MKTHPSLLLLAVLLFAVAGSAQTAGSSSGSSQSSAQTGSSSGTSGSMASQAGSQTSSGSDTEQMMEGCIIREQQDYYLEPINGQEVHLNGPDVAQHVNHHVRIHGNEQPSQSTRLRFRGRNGWIQFVRERCIESARVPRNPGRYGVGILSRKPAAP